MGNCAESQTIVAIDDSFDAVESQYPERKGGVAEELATVIGELALPNITPLFEALRIVIEHSSTHARLERMSAFIRALIERVRSLETHQADTRVKIEELSKAIQIACYRDAESFDDLRRDR